MSDKITISIPQDKLRDVQQVVNKQVLKRHRIIHAYPDTDFVFYDDIDDALIGVVTRFGQEPIICYDYYRCLAIYQERDGISYEEAVEHFEFNVIGGYVGPNTPCFLQKDGSEWMNY
jgi:hypothetical protein